MHQEDVTVVCSHANVTANTTIVTPTGAVGGSTDSGDGEGTFGYSKSLSLKLYVVS